MAKLLATIEREGLSNIRLWDGDATALLPRLAEASLDVVYLLYPDPWPKRRQRKRRFLSDDTLTAFARILRPGGELRFATDIDDYAGWALGPGAALARSRLDRRAPRRLAPPLARLARHALRGQGRGRRAAPELPDVSADVTRRSGGSGSSEAGYSAGQSRHRSGTPLPWRRFISRAAASAVRRL